MIVALGPGPGALIGLAAAHAIEALASAGEPRVAAVGLTPEQARFLDERGIAAVAWPELAGHLAGRGGRPTDRGYDLAPAEARAAPAWADRPEGVAAVCLPDPLAGAAATALPGVATVPDAAVLADAARAAAVGDLLAIGRRLRADCPWDREQDAATIIPHTVEETYELADAIAAGDDAAQVDELGDLLFQVVFLARLLEERDAGDIGDIARGIAVKLVRRHPHVFDDAAADSAAHVERNWEQIKRTQEGRRGVFHSVPSSLPALLYAHKLGRRAAAVGFDWPDAESVLGAVEEELREVREALDTTRDRERHEIGDLLLAAANLARLRGADPEIALREAAARFRTRVERAVALAAEAREDWTALDLAAQQAWYQRAKSTLGAGAADRR